jgi:hypothetical protein
MPINPISFSIPESKIIDHVPEKTRKFAHIVPGDLSTYIYPDEASYYKGYQESVFGRTCKKGGWDCLRHYEILANGCIPWFENLESCPKDTLFRFPKTLVLEAMKSETPEMYIPELMEYTRKYLTTKSMAQYVVDTVGIENVSSVLFLGQDPRPDYLRCLTLTGFKELFGNKCVEHLPIPHIYEDYPTPTQLYGRGFTYTNTIPTSSKGGLVYLEDIKHRKFDLIVYGSGRRGNPAWDIVQHYYEPNEIAILYGEDTEPDTLPQQLGEQGYNVFIREL